MCTHCKQARETHRPSSSQLPPFLTPLTNNNPRAHLSARVCCVQACHDLAGWQAAVLSNGAGHNLQRLGKTGDGILVQPCLLLAKVSHLHCVCGFVFLNTCKLVQWRTWWQRVAESGTCSSAPQQYNSEGLAPQALQHTVRVMLQLSVSHTWRAISSSLAPPAGTQRASLHSACTVTHNTTQPARAPHSGWLVQRE